MNDILSFIGSFLFDWWGMLLNIKFDGIALSMVVLLEFVFALLFFLVLGDDLF